MKTIYLLVKTGEKTFFNRAGVVFDPNRDGSENFKLDLFPDLTFQIRQKDEEDKSGKHANSPRGHGKD